MNGIDDLLLYIASSPDEVTMNVLPVLKLWLYDQFFTLISKEIILHFPQTFVLLAHVRGCRSTYYHVAAMQF